MQAIPNGGSLTVKAEKNVNDAVIAGETDRKKIARELDVSIHTLYSVASDLRAQGYNIPSYSTLYTPSTSIEPKSSVAAYSPAHQESQPGEVLRMSTEDRPQYSPSAGDIEIGDKYFLGDVPEDNVPPPRTTRRSPQGHAQGNPRGIWMTPEQIDQIVEEAMRRTAETLSGEDMSPIQNVDIAGKKVHFRLSVDPEIFFRYNVFKARVKGSGKNVGRHHRNFISFATKDILSVYGMYHTVLTTQGKNIMWRSPRTRRFEVGH